MPIKHIGQYCLAQAKEDKKKASHPSPDYWPPRMTLLAEKVDSQQCMALTIFLLKMIVNIISEFIALSTPYQLILI